MPDTDVQQHPASLVTNAADRLDYRPLRLANGLQVLLAHDPDADRASAAMNVATGSAFNPERFPGLAHFLEHMLFLGTDRYPDPDDYHHYLGEHGGNHNAFTAPRDTNYFFDIDPGAFEGALDRFSRFFIAPLLNADYVERERRAVHSEYQAKLHDDARRIEDALSTVLNPQHPFNHFTVGSLDTLRDHPDLSLREALRRFLAEHYDANTMQLVLLGPQPLDELETLARRCFSEVPNNGLIPGAIDVPITAEGQLPAAIAVNALQQQRHLRFLFPTDDPEREFRLKPAFFLSDLLGHEGEHSLLSRLRACGWADGLSAGSVRGDGRRAMLAVNIELTAEGARHIDAIQATLMAWIALIREHGIAQWRFDEQAQLSRQQFDFQQRLPPARQATALSMAMARYPLAEIRSAPFLMSGFDAERIGHYLDAMRVDNLLRLYSGPDVEGGQQSPWFHAPWRFDERPDAVSAAPLDGLALPGANDFIARDFSLLAVGDERPRALIDNTGLDLWYAPAERFHSPRAEWRLSLQSPQAGSSVRETVLTELLARWLEESLLEKLYPARLAGQDVHAHAHARGMTLTFSGWRDRQLRVIEQVLEALVSDSIAEDDMARAARELERRWRDEIADPLHEQLQRALSRALIHPAWHRDEKLETLAEVSAIEFASFRRRWLSELHVQALAAGNLDEAQARHGGDGIERVLAPRVAAGDIPDIAVLHAEAQPPALRPQSQRGDGAVLRYLQSSERTLDDQAQLALLGQLIDAPFFHQLRTQEQLGYIVAARYLPLLEAPGLMLLVQSPENDSGALIARIDAFLESFDATVEELDDTTLAPWRKAVQDRLNEREQRLAQLSSRLWQDLALGFTRFDRREQLADRVAAISAEALKGAWQSLRQRPKLDVRFDSVAAPNQSEAPWQPALRRPVA
ncbi:insulinase family protein [Kushneria aurantia]|uniref:Protease 3 n=1 Tax=Kushneria aurantia TaxID=504092 RepID=A0ABV6G5V6_9GAMM|nr:insulinase family protein [Kushneria aurantia]